MLDYKSKYLKYKKKYLELKQNGGLIIGNYHMHETPLAMAEAITPGTLTERITSHGLGTGVYGFIDYTTENKYAHTYINDENDLTFFTLKHPIILAHNWIIEGDNYSDLNNFTALSTTLTALCNTIHQNKIDIKEINYEQLGTEIKKFFSDKIPYLEIHGINAYDGIPHDPVTINEISRAVRAFLHDYNIIMTTPTEENYVLMPINYLVYLKKYDGIYNIVGDIPASGSIKYYFDGSIGARGYRPQFKHREPLHGRLIFTPP